jgi:hypothetical protein
VKGWQIIEDQYPETSLEEKVRDALAHWHVQHDYEGILWDGIEAIHLSLASAVEALAIESAGWYSYPSSLRSDMDGKDWRLVITNPSDWYHVVVNCHSVLHDNVWTLATTIYSTNEIDGDLASEESLTNEDPWMRSMIWSKDLATKLQTSGYDYRLALRSMEGRMRLALSAWPIAERWIQIFSNSYEDEIGEKHEFPGKITIAVNDWSLPEGKIASYQYNNDKRPYGILTISPDAWTKKDLLKWVIVHELIHAFIGKDEGGHDDKFKLLADLSGMPKEYQD